MCFIRKKCVLLENETLKILLFTTFAGICLWRQHKTKRLTFLENENV
jgi:hypothetical protein